MYLFYATRGRTRDELDFLKALHEAGHLTRGEYDRHRKAVMDWYAERNYPAHVESGSSPRG